MHAYTINIEITAQYVIALPITGSKGCLQPNDGRLQLAMHMAKSIHSEAGNIKLFE